MIAVVGEALVDLVIRPDGAVTATLGGAPFNTARACGRLGAEVAFVGALSVDRFGSLLLERLRDDGVTVDHVTRVDLPTTLAAAELDEAGAATYRFYIAGTSAPALDGAPTGLAPTILFTGGLALVLEPLATTVETLVAGVGADVAVMVDLNCRPRVIADLDAYRARVDRVVARADVVKASDEDLAVVAPGVEPLAAARELLGRGPRAVLVTTGSGAVHALTAGGERAVPVPAVAVVDTIGAGDSFGGGLLGWWATSGQSVARLGSLEHLVPAVEAAIEVAGVVCGRRGADPPWRAELSARWSGR